MSSSLRVLIAHDDDLVRGGFRQCADADHDLHIVGEERSAKSVRRAVTALQPDVAVFAVALPDGDGIQLCRGTRALRPETRCILLTTCLEPGTRFSAAVAGASALLPVSSPWTLIRRAIFGVTADEHSLGPDAVGAILDGLIEGTEDDGSLPGLTAQERRVFELVGQGLSCGEIAAQLHVSDSTVRDYSSAMLEKLHMTRQAEAAALAARLSERRLQRRAVPVG